MISMEQFIIQCIKYIKINKHNRHLPKKFIYNVTMNREFTRRRRDKGTQVNKRPARTQGSKYGLNGVGQLGLLIMGEAEQGTFINKQNLFKIIHDRKLKFQQNMHPFIYECLKRIQQLEPGNDNLNVQILNNHYANLLVSSNLFYQIEKNTWITAQFLTPKSLRFNFHKELPKQIRVLQNFSLKQLPLKIQDFQIFKSSPPITVLNLGMRLIGMTVSTIREQQKQVFNYELNSKAQKYLIQKDSLFVLLRNGNITFGKIGDELDLLDAGKAKFQQLKLCGSDVLVVTRSYIIKIITPSGNPKKIIRAGVQISNVLPIFISTNMYVLMAQQQGKACILNCHKQGKNNYLQLCPEGLEKIQQTLYLGKWIFLRTYTNKIYVFALIKDKPIKIYEIYNGISAAMIKILHRKLMQS